MAYSLIESQDKPIKQKRTFLCDARTDIDSLPTQNTPIDGFPKGVPAGSEALCTEDMSVWILGNAGIWLEVV